MTIVNKLRLLALSFLGTTKQKYESRHKILVSLARKSGQRMYNTNLYWMNDKEFMDVWVKFPAMKPYIHDRKFSLYYIAKNLRTVAGDIAECGVFTGGSAHVMLSASNDLPKHYYGFDSFEGLSEPIDIDRPQNDHTFKWEKHDLKVDKNFTSNCLAQHGGRVTLYKGWIPDRFPEVETKTFSLVHIDVDLYQPTLDALEFFYPRLNRDGWIVCDDYGSEACPGSYKAMNDFAAKIGTSVIHLTTGQGAIIKRS